MSKQIDYDKALLSPASIFEVPEDVLAQADLTKEQKIEVLRRWEYDASEIAVAEEEGMLGERPLMLRRVILALEQLTGGRDSGQGAPTKQDGV